MRTADAFSAIMVAAPFLAGVCYRQYRNGVVVAAFFAVTFALASPSSLGVLTEMVAHFFLGAISAAIGWGMRTSFIKMTGIGRSKTPADSSPELPLSNLPPDTPIQPQ